MRQFLRSALLFSTLLFFLPGSVVAGPSLIPVSGPDFLLSLKYNSEDNFLKKNLYRDFGLDRCWLHPDLATKLQRLAPLLKEKGLKLVLWDCWRPLAVQQAMWKQVPDPRYVADPKVGSHHNRGVAVDASLAKADGTLVEMPTGFDDFSPFAAANSFCKPEHFFQCSNRDLLFELMAKVGLRPFATEWWHFELPEAKQYPLIEALPGNLP